MQPGLVWLLVELGLLVALAGLSPPCHIPGCPQGCVSRSIPGMTSLSSPWDAGGARWERVWGGMCPPPSLPCCGPKPGTPGPAVGAGISRLVLQRGNGSCTHFAQPGGGSAAVAGLWPPRPLLQLPGRSPWAEPGLPLEPFPKQSPSSEKQHGCLEGSRTPAGSEPDDAGSQNNRNN